MKISDFEQAVYEDEQKFESFIQHESGFTAPELKLKQSKSFKADSYSLGLLAYQLLVGFIPELGPWMMGQANEPGQSFHEEDLYKNEVKAISTF